MAPKNVLNIYTIYDEMASQPLSDSDNIGSHHEEDGKLVHHYEYYESNVKNPNKDVIYENRVVAEQVERTSNYDPHVVETHLREESLDFGRTITQGYHEWQSATSPTKNDKHDVKTFDY